MSPADPPSTRREPSPASPPEPVSGPLTPAARGRRLVVLAALVACLLVAIAAAAVSVAPVDDPSSPGGAPANATTGLERLHVRGVTGEGVSVGVVGVTGFDTDLPALAGRTVEARSFAAGETVRNGGRTDHGTAAASLVARAAPGADLYLASFDTQDGFRRAVAWLLRAEVDVVVAPVEFYGVPGDGTSAAAGVARLAATHDTTLVVPAGTLGRGHWRGRFAPDAAGRHEFPDGPRNYLLDGDGRRATLWLSWSGSESGAGTSTSTDFTLELHRVEGTTTRLVAESRPYTGDAVPNERIVAEIDPDGTYYVVLRGPPNATGTRVEVSSPTHAFQFRERAGSIVAPATAEAAVSVGAYDPRDGRVEPFSSAGPTTDGRPGVDVVAPDRLRAAGEPTGRVGSSAAAPYTAGLVALLLDAGGDRPADEVERLLERTARDVGPDGVDPVAGHGLVAPERAVAASRNASRDSRSKPGFSHGQDLAAGDPTDA